MNSCVALQSCLFSEKTKVRIEHLELQRNRVHFWRHTQKSWIGMSPNRIAKKKEQMKKQSVINGIISIFFFIWSIKIKSAEITTRKRAGKSAKNRDRSITETKKMVCEMKRINHENKLLNNKRSTNIIFSQTKQTKMLQLISYFMVTWFVGKKKFATKKYKLSTCSTAVMKRAYASNE